MEPSAEFCPRCKKPRPPKAVECPGCHLLFARHPATALTAEQPRPVIPTSLLTQRIRSVGTTQDVWRFRKLLVARLGHALPSRCVTCNRPAQALAFKEFTWLPWTGKIQVCLNFMLLLWLFGRTWRIWDVNMEPYRAEVEIPLCSLHERKRNRSDWTLIALVLGAPLALCLATASNGIWVDRFLYAAAGLAAAAVLSFLFRYKPYRLKRIDDQFVWLSRISPRYLKELPEFAE